MVRTNPQSVAATSRERTLAGLLRAEFDARSDISMRQLATQLGVNHSTLSRWLDGKVSPDAERVSGLLACLGVVGDRREQIMRVARGGPSAETWVTPGPTGVAEHLVGAMEMEAQAVAATEWQPLAVPGLLHTREYARAIISRDRKATSADVEHRVTLRLGRQHALLRDDPLPYTAILGVPAIHGRIGGDEVMVPQLKYLVRVASRENVTLRLAEVDGDWHGGLLGSFTLYDFAEPLPSIVALEHHRTASFVDGAADVEDYEQLAIDLLDLAYSPDESLNLINEEIKKRETT
ncbi:helix-turn-helix domain-containing protein [Amycolatopsis sp. NPDC059021]|uniref:helix-turn-helix domain-containing protein n=1 Tax=Amycolatopsis sp. NPDC059021 TaxID=3346704 RepID=UPI00366AD43A